MKKRSKDRSGKGLRKLTWFQKFIYKFLEMIISSLLVFIYGLRVFGSENIPKEGAALIVSNHQSYFDPPLIGCSVPRRLNFFARAGLFKSKIFGGFIRTVDAIPVENEGVGFEGIKETLKRLKNGEMALIFPEGARTFDGEIAPFRRGYLTLALRGGAAIVPCAIQGVFEAWPRTRLLPRSGRFFVMYGEPIPFETAKNIPEDELHELVQAKVAELYNRLRNKEFVVTKTSG